MDVEGQDKILGGGGEVKGGPEENKVGGMGALNDGRPEFNGGVFQSEWRLRG